MAGLAFLFLGGAALPAPSLEVCSFDRTDDVLGCEGYAACPPPRVKEYDVSTASMVCVVAPCPRWVARHVEVICPVAPPCFTLFEHVFVTEIMDLTGELGDLVDALADAEVSSKVKGSLDSPDSGGASTLVVLEVLSPEEKKEDA